MTPRFSRLVILDPIWCLKGHSNRCFSEHIYLEGLDLVTLSPRDETCLGVLYESLVSEITNGQNPN